jgi:hypothetical protein
VSKVGHNGRVGGLMFGIVLVFLVLPRLLYSSPEYRAAPLLLGCLAASWFFWPVLGRGLRGRAGAAVTVGIGVVVAQLAAFFGGVANAADPGTAGWLAIQGIIGVIGLAVLVAVLATGPWPRRLGAVGLGVVLLILLGSYVGYFIGIERFIELGDNRIYFDSFRIALIWPTRMLLASRGQLAWDNTVYAGFYFALAAVLVSEWLAAGRRPGRGGCWWWLLLVLLLAAVFLTGSRAAWLMVGASLPLVVVGRRWRFGGMLAGVLGAAILLGWCGLAIKIATTETSRKNPGERHLAGLISRGSAGRFEGYAVMWDDLAHHRAVGKGLEATGKPVGELLHEHSSILATLRAGGMFALAGHVLVLAAAGWGALGQWRGGRRWPAILLVAVLAAITFDRSSVLRLTGNFEFIAHWVAVASAVVLARPRADTLAPARASRVAEPIAG